ncbi:MAG: hypothetical protein EXR07_05665 [Acetobacteraceae bacterium]|nr:hypothetical protein [Acetobacteraceae bacterium]
MREVETILPDFQMLMEIFRFLVDWVPLDSVLYGTAALISRSYEHHAWKIYVVFALVKGLVGRN